MYHHNNFHKVLIICSTISSSSSYLWCGDVAAKHGNHIFGYFSYIREPVTNMCISNKIYRRQNKNDINRDSCELVRIRIGIEIVNLKLAIHGLQCGCKQGHGCILIHLWPLWFIRSWSADGLLLKRPVGF